MSNYKPDLSQEDIDNRKALILLAEEREALEHGKLWNQNRLWEAMARGDLNLLVTILNDRSIIRKGELHEDMSDLREV